MRVRGRDGWLPSLPRSPRTKEPREDGGLAGLAGRERSASSATARPCQLMSPAASKAGKRIKTDPDHPWALGRPGPEIGATPAFRVRLVVLHVSARRRARREEGWAKPWAVSTLLCAATCCSRPRVERHMAPGVPTSWAPRHAGIRRGKSHTSGGGGNRICQVGRELGR